MKIKRLRKIIFEKIFNDDTLKIYDPYMQISVIPARKTFSGRHAKKIMYSFGMRYNDEKARKFFNSDSPLKEQIIKRLANQANITQENVIKAYKTGTLKDILIEAVALQVKALGIPVILLKKKASFEIYQFVKTSDIDEIMQMIYGMLISLGESIKLFSDSPKDDKIYYQILLKKNIDKLIERGFQE